MTDPLERFAAMRPPTTADHDWADSPDGRQALAGIHRRAAENASDQRRSVTRRVLGQGRSRRLLKPAVAVSAALVVAGGATAAVVIVNRSPTNPAQVLCLRTASPNADGAGLSLEAPTPAAALQACSNQWAQLFPGDPVPAGYAVCVYRTTAVRSGGTGGVQVVIPTTDLNVGSAAACTAAGFDPITP